MSKRLRIAVISTVNRATPPLGYGGIERVVHVFAEELVRQGHDVTVFGRPGSRSSGRVIAVGGYSCEREVSGGRDRLDEEMLYDSVRAFVDAEPPDVIHDWSLRNLFVNRHPDAVPFIASTCIPQPEGYDQANVVAASAAHAAILKDGTVPFVHYGIEVEKVRFSARSGPRLVHLSKIAAYKGQHLAMLAAALARRPLDVVGNVEGQRYYNYLVRPLAAMLPGIRLIGETNEPEKTLGDALALVQAPRWFEIFPLVSLQALAAGTPVVSLRAGGLDEQIEPGVNGFLADGVLGFAEAMRGVSGLSRAACRDIARDRFDVQRMVGNYLALYARVMAGDRW
jgi:glycosyltransferase involved in cell wall biosynthesis